MKPIIAAILVTSLGLASCESVPKINVFQRNTSVDVPKTRPAPMNLGTVQWKVLNIDEMKSLVEKFDNDPDVVFYVMDKSNYEILSMNLAEMERYIRDQAAESNQLREAIGINAGETN